MSHITPNKIPISFNVQWSPMGKMNPNFSMTILIRFKKPLNSNKKIDKTSLWIPLVTIINYGTLQCFMAKLTKHGHVQ